MYMTDVFSECWTDVVNLEPHFRNLTSLVWYLAQLLLSLLQQDKALHANLVEFMLQDWQAASSKCPIRPALLLLTSTLYLSLQEDRDKQYDPSEAHREIAKESLTSQLLGKVSRQLYNTLYISQMYFPNRATVWSCSWTTNLGLFR